MKVSFVSLLSTQNTRLVTPRQRQEIYALNRLMTRLENERFASFCSERGLRGDRRVREAAEEEGDQAAAAAAAASNNNSSGNEKGGANGNGYDLFM